MLSEVADTSQSRYAIGKLGARVMDKYSDNPAKLRAKSDQLDRIQDKVISRARRKANNSDVFAQDFQADSDATDLRHGFAMGDARTNARARQNRNPVANNRAQYRLYRRGPVPGGTRKGPVGDMKFTGPWRDRKEQY